MKIVDTLIEEAMARGEFMNLQGEGKPIDLSAYFDTPEENRLAYSILKNENLLPREAELLKEIQSLKEMVENCEVEVEKKKLLNKIQYCYLSYHILIDRRKGSS